MNSPILFILASVLTSAFRSGCHEPTAVSHNAIIDPLIYGQQFTAVCRIGERGGDGTLIAPEWVLTAGHVAHGMYRRTSGHLHVHFDNGTSHRVERVFLHPEFKPMGRYDIALIQLHGHVEDVAPCSLYGQGDESGQLIHLAGHGDKREPDGTWIKDGRLRAYTNRVDEVNDTHIVFDYDAPGGDATEMEGTSGPGDSGGPAFIHTARGFEVAGISSMGEPGKDGPCSYGAVEHFVRVSQFLDWIDEVMNDPAGQAPYSMEDGGDQGSAPRVVLVGDGNAELGDTPN